MSSDGTPNAKLEQLRREIIELTLFEVRKQASESSSTELNQVLAEQQIRAHFCTTNGMLLAAFFRKALR